MIKIISNFIWSDKLCGKIGPDDHLLSLVNLRTTPSWGEIYPLLAINDGTITREVDLFEGKVLRFAHMV